MSGQSNTSAGIAALGQINVLIKDVSNARNAKQLQEKAAADTKKAVFDNFLKPVDFLLTTHLYEETLFSDELVWPVIDVLYFNGTYDCYCVECGQSATFQGVQDTQTGEHLRNINSEQLHRIKGIDYVHPVLDVGLRLITAKCTRNPGHKQDYVFLIRNEKSGQSIQKIGQFPSYADIHLGEVKNYTSVLTSNQRQDLSKAIGLSSHGIGIGSFVYLRRIFEALVEDAHQIAKTDASWDEATYAPLRMAEKIGALKSQLPTFLTSHPAIYSVLSKGIHELTEDECLTHFDTVKLCIELILDEKLDQKKRTDKIKAASAALHAAAASIK